MAPRRPSHGATAAAVLLAACELGTGPGGGELELERFAPPSAYTSWWRETEACSGLEGDFARVRFYEVKAPVSGGGTRFPCGGGDDALCGGVWQSPHDIYLAPALLASRRVVKHEMLHDLLGAPGHPPVFETCDLVVPRARIARRDRGVVTGGRPPPSAPRSRPAPAARPPRAARSPSP